KKKVSSFWPSEDVVHLASRVVGYGLACLLVLICLVSVPLWIREVQSLFRLEETGYGDSYIFYDVLHFQRTGIIYQDLSELPYLPAQYSPLVYVLYSLPSRIFSWENPFVAPRLVTITAFLACVGICTSIVRKLIPSRFVWAWGILLPFSTQS